MRNRLELQEQRERGLLAAIASAQDLSSRLDLQELLRAIVSRARNLVGSDIAWLSTYDAEFGEFHVLVVDGALSQRPAGMVARRDRGVAGPRHDDPAAVHDPPTTARQPLRARCRYSTTCSARKASPRSPASP
jgi:hypothetical protein